MSDRVGERAMTSIGSIYCLQIRLRGRIAGCDQAFMRVNETIEAALDTKGLLAPGRNGIWPKTYRSKGWELGEKDIGMERIGPRL